MADGFECADDLVLKSPFVQLKSEVNRILRIDETSRILRIVEISLSVKVKVKKAVGAGIITYGLAAGVHGLTDRVGNDLDICHHPSQPNSELVINIPSGGDLHPWSPTVKYQGNSTSTSNAGRTYLRRRLFSVGGSSSSKQTGSNKYGLPMNAYDPTEGNRPSGKGKITVNKIYGQKNENGVTKSEETKEVENSINNKSSEGQKDARPTNKLTEVKDENLKYIYNLTSFV